MVRVPTVLVSSLSGAFVLSKVSLLNMQRMSRPPLGGFKDIANRGREFVNVVLTFMGRTAKGQLGDSNEDQTVGKRPRGNVCRSRL